MKNTIIVILLVLISFVSKSQEKKFLIGLNGGINISKFQNDSLSLRYGTNPYLGVFGNYRFSEKFLLHSTLNYTYKSSSSPKPYLNVVNQYIDFALIPQYEFYKGVYVQAGANYSLLLDSKVTYNLDGTSKQNTNSYNSEFSVVLGMGFELSRNVNLELNYFLPASENKTQTFAIGVRIAINNAKREKPKTFTQVKTEKSIKQIHQLREGVLLVRLQTLDKKVKALQKVGKTEKADNELKKQQLLNKQIVEGFKNNFDFCDVKFFYGENSNRIRERNFSNIFLNDSLQIDNNIFIDTTKVFFIAEFNYLDEDTAKYFSEITYTKNENGDLLPVENYYTSSSMSFMALVIKDSDFVQLKRPFPYWTRLTGVGGISSQKRPVQNSETGVTIPISKTKQTSKYTKWITKMNSNLYKFYENNK